MSGMAIDPSRLLITDELWLRLEPLVSKAKHSSAGAPAGLTERKFIEAVLYLIRSGCPWRDLPDDFGYWHAVYMRFRRWEERGVWRRLWCLIQEEHFEEATELFIDSTTVRAHQHAVGAPKKTVAIRLWVALGVD